MIILLGTYTSVRVMVTVTQAVSHQTADYEGRKTLSRNVRNVELCDLIIINSRSFGCVIMLVMSLIPLMDLWTKTMTCCTGT